MYSKHDKRRSGSTEPGGDGDCKSSNSSDSSFHDEYSIFSRPLKDLPVLSSFEFQYDKMPYHQEESKGEEGEEAPVKDEQMSAQKSPFEWFMSFQH